MNEPVDPETEARVTQRALDAGIWHRAEDGTIVKHPVDEVWQVAPDPVPETAPPPPAAPVLSGPPDPIRAPVEPLRAFNPAWARRKVVPPTGAELNRRLIDEAIAAGRVTKLPPGYAHGAKGPPIPKG